MSIKTKSRIIVFVLGSFVWFALTDIKDLQEVIAGIFVSFLISLIAGQFLITTAKSQGILRRTSFFILYVFRFLWEMIKANIDVAYLVIHPLLPIKPGIVKIKTKLPKASAITMLCNSITLTPGTLTVDINEEEKELYIHWIKVKAEEVDEATEKISSVFEKILMEVFK
jgi:multicomponent Na+:H+ antiporter subunit E